MSYLVYETAMAPCAKDELLPALRLAVQKFRRAYPQLSHCSLADLSLVKKKAAFRLTLYFKKER